MKIWLDGLRLNCCAINSPFQSSDLEGVFKCKIYKNTFYINEYKI